MKKVYFWDQLKVVKRFIALVFLCCLALLLLELLVHYHPHAKWEHFTGFYAAFGFFSVILLVLISKYILRPLVKRKEDYYDTH